MRTERLYKASKRRRQVFLKKLAIVFSVIVIAAGLGITMGSNFTGSNQVSAHDKDIVEKEKYYKSIEIPSLGVSTIIFGSLFRFGTATVSINAGFFCFLKT